jgi:hypothetical protein
MTVESEWAQRRFIRGRQDLRPPVWHDDGMMDARDDVADDTGSHFTMSFDTSPVVLKRLGETLRADPLVVRCV